MTYMALYETVVKMTSIKIQIQIRAVKSVPAVRAADLAVFLVHPGPAAVAGPNLIPFIPFHRFDQREVKFADMLFAQPFHFFHHGLQVFP